MMLAALIIGAIITVCIKGQGHRSSFNIRTEKENSADCSVGAKHGVMVTQERDGKVYTVTMKTEGVKRLARVVRVNRQNQIVDDSYVYYRNTSEGQQVVWGIVEVAVSSQNGIALRNQLKKWLKLADWRKTHKAAMLFDNHDILDPNSCWGDAFQPTS